jgi:hypothetical protein
VLFAQCASTLANSPQSWRAQPRQPLRSAQRQPAKQGSCDNTNTTCCSHAGCMHNQCKSAAHPVCHNHATQGQQTHGGTYTATDPAVDSLHLLSCYQTCSSTPCAYALLRFSPSITAAHLAERRCS